MKTHQIIITTNNRSTKKYERERRHSWHNNEQKVLHSNRFSLLTQSQSQRSLRIKWPASANESRTCFFLVSDQTHHYLLACVPFQSANSRIFLWAWPRRCRMNDVKWTGLGISAKRYSPVTNVNTGHRGDLLLETDVVEEDEDECEDGMNIQQAATTTVSYQE